MLRPGRRLGRISVSQCGLAALALVGSALLAGCVSVTEERWRLYNEDAVLAFARGEYRDALDGFDLALKHHPQDAVLSYNVAQCYDRLGDTKRAEQFYLHSLQLDPKHGDARLALVALWQRTGRENEANQKTLDWLAQDPNSPDPYVADAYRLRQTRDYPAAQGRLYQALALDPANRRALTELAILFEIMGLPERSLVLYERILEREPNQIEIAERFQQLRAKGVQRHLPN